MITTDAQWLTEATARANLESFRHDDWQPPVRRMPRFVPTESQLRVADEWAARQTA